MTDTSSLANFDIFPKYFRNAVFRISPTGFVAIATFWTDKNKVKAAIDRNLIHKVISIGNLYTFEGIKWIIMNTFLCPQVNYFVFTGVDNNHLKDILQTYTFSDPTKNEYAAQFWTYFGKPVDWDTYLSSSGTISTRSFILNDFTRINEVLSHPPISSQTHSQLWIPKIVEIPDDKPVTPSTFESERSGFVVKDTSLVRMWQRALTRIKLFGTVKPNGTKEIISLVSVLMPEENEPLDLTKPDIKTVPAFEILEQYIPQVCTADRTEGLAYTYGSRLHEYGQIDNIIASLSKGRWNRNGVSVTWRPQTDFVIEPPCLILIDCKIQPGADCDYFFMTSYFRSHDIYKAYCMNIVALQRLQYKIMKSVEAQCSAHPPPPTDGDKDKKAEPVKMKPLHLANLTIISNSAHVYEQDFEKLSKMHMLDCSLDFRGYFTFAVDKEAGIVVVRHFDHLNTQLHEWSGRDIRVLLDEMQPYVSEISHAMYIGRELQRAFVCLETGTEYVQDESA